MVQWINIHRIHSDNSVPTIIDISAIIAAAQQRDIKL